jgi:membrane protein YdbS with pleckstrin-like domain
MFQNPEIAIEDLPDMEELEWGKLHPRFVRRIQVQNGLVALVPIAGATVFSILLHTALIQTVLPWVLAIGFAVLLITWPTISVPRRGYVVRDKDIVFRSGVAFQSVTAIPYNRIQHVETSSDPLDRKFDLATLQVFTAGGSGGDLKIDGLGKDVAEQLRAYILKKVGASIESA